MRVVYAIISEVSFTSDHYCTLLYFHLIKSAMFNPCAEFHYHDYQKMQNSFSYHYKSMLAGIINPLFVGLCRYSWAASTVQCVFTVTICVI